jgi:hypothetical protein
MNLSGWLKQWNNWTNKILFQPIIYLEQIFIIFTVSDCNHELFSEHLQCTITDYKFADMVSELQIPENLKL